MDADAAFLDCPAYLDHGGTVRCGLPAVVEDRYTLGSTGGAVAGVKICCPQGHWFSGPADALTVHAAPAPGAPAPGAPAPGTEAVAANG